MKKIILFFSVSLVLFSLSCKKKEDPALTNSDPMYWRANIAGVDFDLTEGSNGYDCKSSTDTLRGTSDFKAIINSTMIRPFSPGTVSAGVSLGAYSYSDYPTVFEFTDGIIDPITINSGNVEFATNTGMPEQDGVIIYYTDANGTYWSSALGSQTGSVFHITRENGGDNNTTYSYYSKIQANFNCTLYDCSGNSKVVQNGECRLYYAIDKKQ